VTAQLSKLILRSLLLCKNSILENGENVHISPSSIDDTTLDKIQFEYDVLVAQGQIIYQNWRIHRFL
jgi:maltose phosphorylase